MEQSAGALAGGRLATGMDEPRAFWPVHSGRPLRLSDAEAGGRQSRTLTSSKARRGLEPRHGICLEAAVNNGRAPARPFSFVSPDRFSGVSS
jgi:hypothetical protein